MIAAVGRYRGGVNRDTIVGWGERHPEVVDGGLGAIAVALSAGAVLYGPRSVIHSLAGLDIVVMVFSVLVVAFRRRYPLTVFCILGVAVLLVAVLGGNSAVAGGALLLAAWTIGLREPRPVSLVACGAVTLALLVRAVAGDGVDGLRAENVNQLILLLLATASGIAVRDRRAYLRALRERAERAELGRETEAARRVAEERLRIARDLHDSLAHHMAVVNVQTGVAQHLLTSDPVAAGVALGHARSAAGQVLDELGTVLGVLRQQAGDESTEPTPSLSGLAALTAPLRAAGMDLRITISGLPRALSPAVDQAAYRLIQEALTNAQKHATESRVILVIDYQDASVALEVRNSGTGSPEKSVEVAGFGIAGMRERSAAVGGTVEAGPVAGGGFRVFAVLPAAAGIPVNG